MRAAFAAYAHDHQAASIRRCWSTMCCTHSSTPVNSLRPTRCSWSAGPNWPRPSLKPSPAPLSKHCYRSRTPLGHSDLPQQPRPPLPWHRKSSSSNRIRSNALVGRRAALRRPRWPTRHPGTLSRIKRAFKLAGPDARPVPDALVHGPRHTYATELAGSDVSVYTLMKLLGHESMTTSQRYVTAAGTETRSAAA